MEKPLAQLTITDQRFIKNRYHQLHKSFQDTLYHQREELINLRSGKSGMNSNQNQNESLKQDFYKQHEKESKFSNTKSTTFSKSSYISSNPKGKSEMKEIRKFSKNLTKNNLMQADIFTEFENQGFQEKVQKCFDYRIKKL